MIRIFDFSKKELSKNLFDGKLGAELLGKNKAIESLNKTSRTIEKAYREKEAHIAKKEKMLAKKAEILQRLEKDLKLKESGIREEVKRLDAEIKKFQDRLCSFAEKEKSLRGSIAEKEEEIASMHERLHGEASIMIEIAQRHVRMKSYSDVKRAYDSIRAIYPKLSPQGKKRIHADIARLREDIMRKFY